MIRNVKFALICGSGFEKLFSDATELQVETPYGAAFLSTPQVGDRVVAFLPRHGWSHSIPPHRINNKANIWALHDLGVERIIALNAVGAINRDFQPCDIVIPHDFIDCTKTGPVTFYDEAPVTHIDMTQPYCPETQLVLLEALKKTDFRVWDEAVFACTDGPRYETPSEVNVLRRLGADIVGMTGVHEAVLARELEMCYAPVCYVSNMAAGLQRKLSPVEVAETSKLIASRLGQALIEAVKALPLARAECPCRNARESARFP